LGWRGILATLALSVGLSAQAGSPTCTVGRLAELPVTMNGTRPLVHAQVNGAEAVFIADSGAFYSTLTSSAAQQFNLRLNDLPSDFVLTPEYEPLHGVGGAARTWITTVKTFTLAGEPINHIAFLVTPNDLGGEAVGLIGQNVLAIGDVEYDLAQGMIRLMRAPHGCKDIVFAYWTKAGEAYSVLDIEKASEHSRTTGSAYLNGSHIGVLFDTGAATSILTLAAARRAGMTPESPGVIATESVRGIGRRVIRAWIAPFASFKVGDEEIRNVKLRVGDIELANDIDMLLGADFFLSHHIYVANSQRKLYFTYNGGPVFNLKGAAAAEGTAAAAALGTQPADADGFARRGAAFTARHDYAHAIADLTRACELAPMQAGYFYLRALAHQGNQQADLALADLDQSLRLKPDDVPALLARAQLRADRADTAGALADLDAADRAAAPEAPARLRMGALYERLGQFAPAVAQYSRWIGAHDRDDVGMGSALNLRCWARAQWGRELEQALADCDRALDLRPGTGAFLDSRGLVHLRRNELNKAVADYDAALHLDPRRPWSLYGRGVARLRQGRASEGQADLSAAAVLDPTIAAQAARVGIGP
jgi:tetratricopeptide (TPR) repeat protein